MSTKRDAGVLRADPPDEPGVPGLVGEGLTGARVEDVLDELGAAADDDDLVGRRVRDLDVVAGQVGRDVVGDWHATEQPGQRGQVLGAAEVDDRDRRAGVLLVADGDAGLATAEGREAAQRREQLARGRGIGRDRDDAALDRIAARGDDDAGVAHPADDLPRGHRGCRQPARVS